MTQEFLQDAVVSDLEGLFADYLLNNSRGVAKHIQVYPQDLPIREGRDVDDTDMAEAAGDDVPEPYVIVRTRGGKIPDEEAPQAVQIVLVICVNDPDASRQGHRDILHIINKIYLHYARTGIVGGRYVLRYPIEWTTQDEDTHPYYFGAMALTIETPAIRREMPI